jgi:hypothetical protein
MFPCLSTTLSGRNEFSLSQHFTPEESDTCTCLIHEFWIIMDLEEAIMASIKELLRHSYQKIQESR